MFQNMQQFIAGQIVVLLIAWALSVVFGLWVKMVNDKVLYVRNLAFALIFGPIYLGAVLSDMDAILWDRRKKN